MKIILTINGLGIGGAEIQVIGLAERFVARGHVVKIVTLSDDIVLRPMDPRVDVVSLRMKKSVVDFVSGFFVFHKVVNEFRPDVVHSHMKHANIFVRLYRIFFDLPFLISSSHTSNEESKFWLGLYRYTDWLSDVVTNVSVHAVNEFRRCRAASDSKLQVVSNGIDLAKFRFCEKSRVAYRLKFLKGAEFSVFIAVGRLTTAKDYPNLLTAFATLRKSTMAKLWIVGDGPLESEIRAIATSLCILDDVLFLGARLDIPQLLSASDIFVLSSAWEGFGLVIAEAMACSRPVIATDCGGTSEVLGSNGWLVPVGNSVALCNAMHAVLNLSENTRVITSEQSRQYVALNFSFDAVVDKWLDLYAKRA